MKILKPILLSILLLLSINIYPASEWYGTAFFIARDGYLVTAKHCVKDSRYLVIIYRHTMYNATIIGYDSTHDIAIIHINVHNKSFFTLHKTVPLLAQVMSKGYALGRDTLSSERGSVIGYDAEYNAIIMSNKIYPGDSGGVILNNNNEAIGVISKSTMYVHTPSYAIDINYVINMAYRYNIKLEHGNGSSQDIVQLIGGK